MSYTETAYIKEKESWEKKHGKKIYLKKTSLPNSLKKRRVKK